MKTIPVYLIISIALVCCAAPARADEATKSAKAEELIELTQTGQMMKMMEPMMKGMMAQANKDIPSEQRAKVGEMQEKILSMMAVRMNKAKPALAKVYIDTYTEEELDAILTFYKSPAGKSLIQKMPEVMQRSMPVMMQMMSDLQPEIMKMMEGLKEKSK